MSAIMVGQAEAAIGEGVQAKVDVHIWFKIFVFNCLIKVKIITPESINIYCILYSVNCI